MATASDLMTRNPLTLDCRADVLEAVSFFSEHKIVSLPVLSPTGQVLGQITEVELMKAFVQRKVDKSSKTSLQDFMHLLLKPSFVNIDDPISTVVSGIIKSPVHRVLVRTSVDPLVGVISPRDILDYFQGGESKSLAMLKEIETLKEQILALKDAIKNAKAHLEVYANLFNSSPYMMYACNKEGCIVMANKKTHSALGFGKGELIGKIVLDMYPTEEHVRVGQALAKMKADDNHSVIYLSMQKKSGEHIRVEQASNLLRDREGEFMGVFFLTREIDSDQMLRALHGVFKE
ncbi:MAG: CBS domain-containing protein [Pseudobdellovibrionaceae bacterium]